MSSSIIKHTPIASQTSLSLPGSEYSHLDNLSKEDWIKLRNMAKDRRNINRVKRLWEESEPFSHSGQFGKEREGIDAVRQYLESILIDRKLKAQELRRARANRKHARNTVSENQRMNDLDRQFFSNTRNSIASDIAEAAADNKANLDTIGKNVSGLQNSIASEMEGSLTNVLRNAGRFLKTPGGKLSAVAALTLPTSYGISKVLDKKNGKEFSLDKQAASAPSIIDMPEDPWHTPVKNKHQAEQIFQTLLREDDQIMLNSARKRAEARIREHEANKTSVFNRFNKNTKDLGKADTYMDILKAHIAKAMTDDEQLRQAFNEERNTAMAVEEELLKRQAEQRAKQYQDVRDIRKSERALENELGNLKGGSFSNLLKSIGRFAKTSPYKATGIAAIPTGLAGYGLYRSSKES